MRERERRSLDDVKETGVGVGDRGPNTCDVCEFLLLADRGPFAIFRD